MTSCEFVYVMQKIASISSPIAFMYCLIVSRKREMIKHWLPYPRCKISSFAVNAASSVLCDVAKFLELFALLQLFLQLAQDVNQSGRIFLKECRRSGNAIPPTGQEKTGWEVEDFLKGFPFTRSPFVSWCRLHSGEAIDSFCLAFPSFLWFPLCRKTRGDSIMALKYYTANLFAARSEFSSSNSNVEEVDTGLWHLYDNYLIKSLDKAIEHLYINLKFIIFLCTKWSIKDKLRKTLAPIVIL